MPETSYSDNSQSFSVTASSTTVGNLTYSVAQIRDAHGINNIPDFGSETPDGTGQTIAIVDDYNDPTIFSDLDGFDEAMNLSSNTSPTLYQAYGPASSILTVYNMDGTNITDEIADSGTDGVPPVDPTGDWENETTLDVEWAHAIARRPYRFGRMRLHVGISRRICRRCHRRRIAGSDRGFDELEPGRRTFSSSDGAAGIGL